MKPKYLTELREKAGLKAGPFSAIAADPAAFRGGAPQYAVIEARIEAAGLVVETIPGSKAGAWVKVWRPYTAEERAACHPDATDADCRYLVAQGASPEGRDDALLHALLGAVREEHAAKVVGDALAAKGYQVTPDLRRRMEERFITQGGDARLAEDLKAFELAAAK